MSLGQLIKTDDKTKTKKKVNGKICFLQRGNKKNIAERNKKKFIYKMEKKKIVKIMWIQISKTSYKFTVNIAAIDL